MSPSEMNSADDASHSCSQPENGFIDSASCVNSEKAILELELSEAWGTVEKVLRRAAEGKASAQAEAAEWKREYELERAWNRDFQRQDVEKALRRAAEGQASAQAEAAEWKRKYELERARNFQRQDKISGGNHDDDVHCKNTQNLDAQSDSCNQTNEQPERCWAEHGICSREVLVNGENDFASGAIQNRMMRKASFKLSWRCKGETSDPHKHDIVSFEEGNITTARRASKQIALKWESPPQTVLIVTKKDSDPVRARCVEIVRWLKDHKNLNIYVEPDVRSELLTDSSYFAFVQTWQNDSEIPDLHKKVDLVVTLGGDGTVLWAASMFKGAVPPVVPFALGSLGFMTPFHSERYKEHLDSILEGPINITLRHRLRCQVVRHSATNERKTEEPILVFNEVTIARGILSCLTNLECYFDDTYVTLVQGDGLILSTTSGSTAYSLAAGGSIVHPQVPGILFTPVCPHSLSFRPLILPEHFIIRVQVPLNGSSAYASFDGKRRTELAAGDALICSMGPCPVPTACLGDSTTDFLHSIQDCLHWNKRKAQSSDGPRHYCECCFLPNIRSLGIGQQS